MDPEVAVVFVSVIDLSLCDRDAGRASMARAIDAALERSGFFIIVNHSVKAELVNKMFAVTNGFFALPDVEKDVIAHCPGISGYRRFGGTTAQSMDQGRSDRSQPIRQGRPHQLTAARISVRNTVARRLRPRHIASSTIPPPSVPAPTRSNGERCRRAAGLS